MDWIDIAKFVSMFTGSLIALVGAIVATLNYHKNISNRIEDHKAQRQKEIEGLRDENTAEIIDSLKREIDRIKDFVDVANRQLASLTEKVEFATDIQQSLVIEVKNFIVSTEKRVSVLESQILKFENFIILKSKRSQ